MLFHITARHDHVTCLRKDPSRRPSLLSSKDLAGVKTVGVWVDAPSHTIYAVLESDSAEAIREACEGFMDIGLVEVRLVTTPQR
jgi:hypothetical protein